MTRNVKSARGLALLVSALGLYGVVAATTRDAAADRNPARPGLVVVPVNEESPTPAKSGALRDAYANLALRFEENRGQTDPAVRFLARSSDQALFLTDREAVLKFRGRRAGKAGKAPIGTLRMKLEGASQRPAVTGLERQANVSHYLRGRNAGNWATGVANFARVRYKEVYPGVDLVYYGNQRALEYDFLVAPGVDAGKIRLSFSGAQSARVDARGDLVLRTAAGDVRQEKPVVYQEIGGKRRAVSGAYDLLSSGKEGAPVRVAFRLGGYDRSRALVIDPKVLTYSTYLGGTLDDEALAVAVDDWGNAYVAGRTLSPDFPNAGLQNTLAGGEDGFIAKLNPAGCGLVYTTYLGGGLPAGSADDACNAIAVDEDGSVYVAGRTDSEDFPVTAGAYQETYSGGAEAFVAKLNPAGDALDFSSYLGTASPIPEGARGVAVDPDHNVYIVGSTGAPDFPVTPGAFQETYGGGDSDIFVTKFSPDGSSLLYSTFIGGGPQPNKTIGNDFGHAITVDEDGNAYITGTTNSFNFPKSTPFQSGVSGFDAFVVKLNPDGSNLVFSSLLGGNGPDEGNGIALDADRNVYIAGTTGALTVQTVPQAVTTFIGGDTDAFAAKVAANGRGVVYYTHIGGRGADEGRGIAVDSAGNAYVVGCANYANVVTKRDRNFRSASAGDAFVARLSTSGSLSRYIALAGAPGRKHAGDDCGNGIAVDPFDNVYAVGVTDSNNFPTGIIPPIRPVNISHLDGFVVKIASTPAGRINIRPRRIRYVSVGGQPVSRTVFITNNGKKPVAVTLGSVAPPFYITSPETQFVVQPRQQKQVQVMFAQKLLPGSQFSEVLEIYSTAGNAKSCFKINLSALVR